MVLKFEKWDSNLTNVKKDVKAPKSNRGMQN
jgi:hypothetical protein